MRKWFLLTMVSAALASPIFGQANDTNYDIDNAQRTGETALLRRDYSGAVKAFTKCLDFSGGKINACYLGRGEGYVNLRLAADAIADAEVVLKRRPSAEAYLLRAAANCLTGKQKAVKEDVARAETFGIAKVAEPCVYKKPTYTAKPTAMPAGLEIDENNTPALRQLMSDAELLQKNIVASQDITQLKASSQPALDKYTETIKAYPSFAKAYSRRARILTRLFERATDNAEKVRFRDRAIADYTSSIELRKKNPNALLTLKTRFDAIDFLARGTLNLVKVSSVSGLNAALDVLTEGKSKADESWKKDLIELIIADATMAVEINNSSVETSNGLSLRGNALVWKGEKAAAIRDFEAALKLNPNNKSASTELAKLKQTAVATPKPTPAPTPTYRPSNPQPVYNASGVTPESLYAKAQKQVEAKQYDEAIKTLTEALRLWPDNYAAIGNRGIVYRLQKRYELAIADFDKVLKTAPNGVTALVERGTTYAEMGSLQLAIADYDRAVKLAPNDPTARSMRGRFHYKTRNFDAALADYDEMVRLVPNDPAVWDARGTIYQDKSEFDLAVADYTKAIALDPTFLSPHAKRAQIRMVLADFSSAIADYTEVIRLSPNSPEGYFGRGYAYHESKQLQKAISDYTQALKFAPRSTEILLYRGYANAALGQKEPAIADFRAVLAIDPSLNQARQELRKLGVEP